MNLSQTLYNPREHKWGNQRHVRAISLPNLANKKYLNVINAIVKDHLLPKLQNWIQNINEQHKKGLRVIEKVVEMKGSKKFKYRNESKEQASQLLDLKNLKYEDAQKEFRRITNTTHYAQAFGVKPKMLEDYEILKYKKFSELQLSSILKPHIAHYIEIWLEKNDQEEFVGKIYFTLREIFTVIRNQEAPTSLTTQDYSWFKIDKDNKVPRFDKLILQHKGKKPIEKKDEDLEYQNFTPSRKLQQSLEMKMKSRFSDPIMDPRKTKQDFFSGNGNITGFCELNDPKVTYYQDNFKGLQLKNQYHKIKHDFYSSMCIGGIIPDPTFIGHHKRKHESFHQDLKTMTKKFLTSASSPHRESFDNSHSISFSK